MFPSFLVPYPPIAGRLIGVACRTLLIIVGLRARLVCSAPERMEKMDNEKLDNVLGWIWDTAQKSDENSAAALRAGVDLTEALDFFDPNKLLDALAGRELREGFCDFEGETRGEFILWAKDAICAEPETEPAQIPTQPPEFKLPYGWIELHQLGEHYPLYVKTSTLTAIEPMTSPDCSARVHISGERYSFIACTETSEQVMEKITKSYPSISERFGGCI